MKNKVLLTMLIVFIVLAGLWIMCGTIFVVRDVEIVAADAGSIELTAQEKTQIIDKTELQGKNILFSVNADKVRARLKDFNDVYKVQSVKAEFPNKVVITLSKRVPIYYDSVNKCYFDADMCIVKGTAANCVNIAGVNLSLQHPTVGEMAVGTTAADNRKIEQLKTIGQYYPSLSGFAINYVDDDSEVGAYLLCLELKIKSNVTFRIKTAAGDNFGKMLDETNRRYRAQPHTGTYHVLMDTHGNIVIDVEGEVL